MIRGDYHAAQRAYDCRMPPPDDPELPAEWIDEAKDLLMEEPIYDVFWRLGRYETGVVGTEYFTERNRQDCGKAIEMIDKALEKDIDLALHERKRIDPDFDRKDAVALREKALADLNVFDIGLLIDQYAKGEGSGFFSDEDREFFSETVRIVDECIDLIAEWYAYLKAQNHGEAPKTDW